MVDNSSLNDSLLYNFVIAFLKYNDQNIDKIIGWSKYCQVSQLNKTRNWADLGIQGSLFIIHRNVIPNYQIKIIGQKRPKDLTIDINSKTIIEKKVDLNINLKMLYVIQINNNVETVFGIDFSSKHELKQIYSECESLINSLKIPKTLNVDTQTDIKENIDQITELFQQKEENTSNK